MKVSKFKFFSILAIALIAFAIVLPSFISERTREKMPRFLQGDPIALGLDLKGGAYILLEADIDTVVKEKNTQIKDIVRKELRGDKEKGDAMIPYANLTGTANWTTVIIKNPEDIKEAKRRIQKATVDEVEMELDGNKMKIFYSEASIQKMKTDILNNSKFSCRKLKCSWFILPSTGILL